MVPIAYKLHLNATFSVIMAVAPHKIMTMFAAIIPEFILNEPHVTCEMPPICSSKTGVVTDQATMRDHGMGLPTLSFSILP